MRSGTTWIPVLCLTLLALPASGSGPRQIPQRVTADQVAALHAMEERFGPLDVRFDSRRGTVRWLHGVLSERVELTEAGLRPVLHRLGPLLRLRSPDTLLAFAGVTTDRHGGAHATWVTRYRGLPVWGSRLTLHANRHGVVTDLTGDYHTEIRTTIEPTMSIAEALEAARAALGAGQVALIGRPNLVFARRGVLYRHAYHLRVRTDAGPFELVADATAPQLIAAWPLRHSAEYTPSVGKGTSYTGQPVTFGTSFKPSEGTYYLYDFRPEMQGNAVRTSDANNTGEYDDASLTPVVSPSNVFKDTAAVDGHRFTQHVLDYFYDNFGWSSWDGDGSEIYVAVHVGSSMANAYWDVLGRIIAFGDGDGYNMLSLTRCLDIVGHELTHGVVDGTVQLIYELQSGALNEHIADAFGTFVDPPTGGPTDWQLAEDCAAPGAATPFLRHMKHPELGGQPAHAYEFMIMSNDYWNDYGGVHYNSGIPNKALTLMVGNLGITAVSTIYFQLLEGLYLGPTSEFHDFRDGLISACGAVFGGQSIQCGHVKAAMTQVGIHGPAGPSSCPSGSSPHALFGCRCNEGGNYDYSTASCTGGTTGCGGLPETGKCDGDVLSICQYGSVTMKNCAAAGKVCEFDYYQYKYACVEPPNACGGVSAAGECSGNVLQVCVAGKLQSTWCSQIGYVCVESGGGASCQPPSSCTANCSGKSCGNDGCGGVCGLCGSGKICNSSGQCVSSTSSCGAIDWTGVCEGEVLKYCEAGNLKVYDCAATGMECGWEAAKGYYNCVPANPNDSCNGVPPQGECNGNVLSYCDGGQLHSVDCGAYGTTCSQDPNTGSWGCGANADPCGGITFEGQCQGQAVVWCENGALQTLQCTGDTACGWNHENAFYDCIPDTGCVGCDPCGGVPAEGTCAGNTLKWCEGGQILVVNCGSYGQICGDDGDGKGCIDDVPPDACGGIDDHGACDGNDYKVCIAGNLATIDCTKYGKVCGLVPGTQYHDCVPGECVPSCGGKACGPDGCGGSCGTCGEASVCLGGTCETAATCGEIGFPGICQGDWLIWCQEGSLKSFDCQAIAAHACGAATESSPPYMDCVCAPSCLGAGCGPDGCGGTCGECAAGLACQSGQCVCAPDCDGKTCGPDGCGGVCGVCPGAHSCEAGQCTCTPSCDGSECGGDGCGGSCGECEGSEVCLGGQCVCTPDCSLSACGDDGCGGTCGTCGDGTACISGQCEPTSNDGTDATDGTVGTDGTDAPSETDGTDATPGTGGTDGTDGAEGSDGTSGSDDTSGDGGDDDADTVDPDAEHGAIGGQRSEGCTAAPAGTPSTVWVTLLLLAGLTALRRRSAALTRSGRGR